MGCAKTHECIVVEKEVKRFFIDLELNLTDGLPHYTTGLIEEDYTKNGKGSPSGKDYCVAFIDHGGEVNREWRAVDEIKLLVDNN